MTMELWRSDYPLWYNSFELIVLPRLPICQGKDSSHQPLIIVRSLGCFVVKQTSINWKTTRECLRFVFRDTTSSCENLLTRGDFLPLSLYRIRCLGIEVYKCFNGLNPDYLNNLFKQPCLKYELRDMGCDRSVTMDPNYGIYCHFQWKYERIAWIQGKYYRVVS